MKQKLSPVYVVYEYAEHETHYTLDIHKLSEKASEVHRKNLHLIQNYSEQRNLIKEGCWENPQ